MDTRGALRGRGNYEMAIQAKHLFEQGTKGNETQIVQSLLSGIRSHPLDGNEETMLG